MSTVSKPPPETSRPTVQRRERRELTAGEAAKLLGVSSRNTVKNWLQGGYFPGAFKTPGGHWRFPRAEVLEVREQMRRMREQPAELPSEAPDGEQPPLL